MPHLPIDSWASYPALSVNSGGAPTKQIGDAAAEETDVEDVLRESDEVRHEGAVGEHERVASAAIPQCVVEKHVTVPPVRSNTTAIALRQTRKTISAQADANVRVNRWRTACNVSPRAWLDTAMVTLASGATSSPACR